MSCRLLRSVFECHLKSVKSMNMTQSRNFSHILLRVHPSHRQKLSTAVISVRCESSLPNSMPLATDAFGTNDTPVKIDVSEEVIPEPPSFPESLEELAEAFQLPLNAAGEPTLKSLGLGGWSPSGLVQTWLEYMHADMGLPWWGAIAVGTVCVRLLVFPLVIKAQKNAANLNNNMPLMQIIQANLTKARQMGDQLQAARYSQELLQFMKEKDVNPIKSMIVPMAQLPIFMSFFFGLRAMANLPVDSMMSGGLYWFTDLTVCDPYYLLPLMTSSTLALTIYMGVDGARLATSQHGHLVKYVVRAMPFVIFPFIINFPAAMLCYWVSTNLISLIQVNFLRIPAVRKYFKIDEIVKHDPVTLPIKDKGFKEGIKESWKNIKITRELEDRERYDEVRFQKAGIGPLVKTYKDDPTRQTDPSTPPPTLAAPSTSAKNVRTKM